MTRAYSYTRISTLEQSKGRGIERQLAATRDFCQKHNLNLIEEMSDVGLSAFHQAHLRSGALGAFLEAIRAGKVTPGSYLIIENLDRLSRAALPDAIMTLLEIIRAGVLLATISDGAIYSAASPETQIIIGIMTLARGHGESARKSELSKATWRIKRAKAEERPITSVCPGWMRWSKENGQFEIIEERAAVVRDIFNWAKEGKGKNWIARRLNEQERPTLKDSSKFWQPSSVYLVLTKKAVFGEFQPHTKVGNVRTPDGPPIQNYYPAIMSKAEFYASQPPRGKKFKSASGSSPASLLTPFSKCGACNGPMRKLNKQRTVKGKTFLSPYIVCRNSMSGGCKGSKCWPHRLLERAIVGAVAVYCAKHLSLSDAAERSKRSAEARHEAAKAAREDAEKRLDAAMAAIGASVSEALRRRLEALGKAVDEAMEAEQKAEKDLMDALVVADLTDAPAAMVKMAKIEDREAALRFMRRVVRSISFVGDVAKISLIDDVFFKVVLTGSGSKRRGIYMTFPEISANRSKIIDEGEATP
ncbi:MAG TPA: hypothetical protein DDZ34_04815 [Syntrophaceae bacterium]|nr:hypothetical protein [Syntrophaceae bacterium]